MNALNASEREVEHPDRAWRAHPKRCSSYRSDLHGRCRPYEVHTALQKESKTEGLETNVPTTLRGIEFQSISLNVFDPDGTYYAPANVEFVIIIALTRLTIQAPAASF